VSNGDATSHTHRRGRNHLGPVDLGRNPVPILEEMHDGIGRTGLGAAKSRQWRAPAPTRRPFNVFLSTPSQETKKKKNQKNPDTWMVHLAPRPCCCNNSSFKQDLRRWTREADEPDAACVAPTSSAASVERPSRSEFSSTGSQVANTSIWVTPFSRAASFARIRLHLRFSVSF
jgi:hypothetical protein